MDRLALVDWIGWEGVQVAMEAPPVNAVEPEETREGGSFIHGNVIDFPEFHTRLAKPQKCAPKSHLSNEKTGATNLPLSITSQSISQYL